MKDTIPTITTGPLPASTKVYLPGEIHDIRVPMRQIAVSNEDPLSVYDSSGPYSDRRPRSTSRRAWAICAETGWPSAAMSRPMTDARSRRPITALPKARA